MSWIDVRTDSDLAALDRLIWWEDSELLEVYARAGHESFFPDDISRSGHAALNYFLLYRAAGPNIAFVELALIHCERLTSAFLKRPSFRGRVDSLKRTEVWDARKSTLIRCARVVYRIHGPTQGLRAAVSRRSSRKRNLEVVKTLCGGTDQLVARSVECFTGSPS